MVAEKLVTEAPQAILDSRLPLLSAAGVSARVNAIVLEQYSFLNERTNTLGIGGNLLVLCAFLVAFLALATLVLRRSRVSQ